MHVPTQLETALDYAVKHPVIPVIGSSILLIHILRRVSRANSKKNVRKFSCKCGKFNGTVSIRNAMRMGCYDSCCAKFAKFAAEQDPHHVDTKNAFGSVDAILVAAQDIHLSNETAQVIENLNLRIKLTDDTRTVRTLSACCRTPMMIGMNSKYYPQVGIFTAIVEGGENLPLKMHVMAEEPHPDVPNTYVGLAPTVVAVFLKRVCWMLILGQRSPRAIQFEGKYTLLKDLE